MARGKNFVPFLVCIALGVASCAAKHSSSADPARYRCDLIFLQLNALCLRTVRTKLKGCHRVRRGSANVRVDETSFIS